jgi:DNA phosphorothioation-dependent restriction protein DptG
MGYRSQVQVLVAGKRGDVFELLHWMEVQKRAASEDKYLENHWDNLIRMQDIVQEDSEEVQVAFCADWFKAHDPWDKVVRQVEKYCTEKELGFAYGRLGEETSDVDTRDNGKGLYTYYTRKFNDPFSDY